MNTLKESIQVEGDRIEAALHTIEDSIHNQIKGQQVETQRVHDIQSRIDNIRDRARWADTLTISDIEKEIVCISNLPIGDNGFQEFRSEAQDAKIDALAALADILDEKLENERIACETAAGLKRNFDSAKSFERGIK